MHRLGYQKYGAVGNDAGSMINPELGRVDAEHVVALHVTQIFSFPSGDPKEMENMTKQEMDQMKILQWFYTSKMSFNTVMSQQPQTLAFALQDSPVGLPAWNAQLFDEELDPDFILTNIMLYWINGTGASAARLYYENAHATPSNEPTTVPIGVAAFGGDFTGIRWFAERDHKNIVQWNEYEKGGHFAAHKVPTLLADDVRKFFRPFSSK